LTNNFRVKKKECHLKKRNKKKKTLSESSLNSMRNRRRLSIPTKSYLKRRAKMKKKTAKGKRQLRL
jgi:hypothetical protein